MTGNKNSFLCTLLLINSFLCAMDSIPQHITYEDFKFTRPYGKILFMWDISLPKEIIDKHIKPHIANIIVAKFQQRLLNDKYEKKKRDGDPEILPISPVHSSKEIMFQHPNGFYSFMPDIGCDYALCNRAIFHSKIFEHSSAKEPLILNLRNTNQEKSIKVYSSLNECKLNDRRTIYIEVDKRIFKYEFDSRINCLAMSHDSTLLLFGSAADNNNIELIDLNSLESRRISCDGPITALCAAHHSAAFIVCTENDETNLIMSNKRWRLPKQQGAIKTMQTAALFSPDDKQCLTYNDHTFTLWEFNGPLSKNKKSYSYCTVTTNGWIQKAFFAPNSQLIIFAMKDGQFAFYNSIKCTFLTHCDTQWRVKPRTDNPAPLVICSPKSKLLFAVDPGKYTENFYNTLTIHKSSGKFDLLAACSLYPHVPCVIGLTSDEKSLIFTDINDASIRLDLYTDQDLNDIAFIEEKASLYQLCELLQLCKKVKENKSDMKSKIFVDAVRNYIQNDPQPLYPLQ